MLRFGTDGVRGVAYTEVTTEYVAALGRAAAQVLGGGNWLVGRDPRESSFDLAGSLASGLVDGGADVTLTDVLPTPAVAYWAARHDRPAAMVTASHNPYHDNGVKIFGSGGVKLSDEVERSIEAALAASVKPDEGWYSYEHATELVDDYVDHLTAMFEPGALGGLRVVLDCANGSMSEIAERPFLALGAMVSVIHAAPDGRNINDACGATSPGSLCAAVIEQEAHLGLAFDGDGDRVIAVDEHGNVVDGDRLIALAALQLRDEGRLYDDTVVVTVMSNLGFRRAMQAAGIKVIETAVGDRYVLEALDAGGFSVGGEQSGHIIYRDLATTGDGLLAGLRLAASVVQRATSLAELAEAVMTTFPQVLLNVRVAVRHPGIASELADEIALAELALGGEGRVLVRASGTEPLIRVMVEAATEELARRTAASLATVVLDRFG